MPRHEIYWQDPERWRNDRKTRYWANIEEERRKAREKYHKKMREKIREGELQK